jgi:hypothetical protein
MPLVNLNYFGNRSSLIVESPGEVTTDLYGLETCVAVYKCPMDRFDLIPPMFAYHPIFTYLNLERRRFSISPGFLIITGEFAGILNDTAPIYELTIGVSEEPLETHPKFVTNIAGTPSSPLNGAVFLDEQGRLTTDDAVGIFDRFRSVAGGLRNIFAGISAYLSPAEVTWRQIYITKTRPSSVSDVGYIGSPVGSPPGLSGSRNWLYTGLTYQQRGLCYAVTREWRASGPTGWNTTIYTP